MDSSDRGGACGVYAVLVTAMIAAAERCGPTGNAKKAGDFDWSHVRQPLADTIRRFLGLELARVIEASADREAIVSNLVKATHSLLESPLGLKSGPLKKTVMDGWVNAVVRQGFVHGMKTIILQDLNYFEALSEPLAEFVALLSQVDEHSTMVQELLEQIGGHRFKASEAGSVKIISVFLVGLARLAPRDALRSITEFISQMDCESYVMRMAMVEILGCLITHLGLQDKTDQTRTQIRSFLAVLEERLMDVNAFVRARVLHVFGETLRNGALPIARRARVLAAVIGRIQDKSSNVRRRAIQMLGDFLRTHPFCVEGGELSLRYFAGRLQEIDRLIAASAIPDGPAAGDEADLEGRQPAAFDPAKISTLLLQKRYYTDALQFVRQLEAVVPTLCMLLASTTRTEVVDVMDFFVEAHLYRLDGAAAGLRRMMHLVWERDLSYEDGTRHSVKEYLFEAYRKVYLETDARLGGRERCEQVALNLVAMTGGATMAELASLEPIVVAMLQKQWLPDGVVAALFGLLAAPAGASAQRRAALVLLAVVSKERPALVASRMDVLVRAGFASTTDPAAAQFTLVALRSLGAPSGARLPNASVIFGKVLDFVRLSCGSLAWFECISEALKTVYVLAEFPGTLCEALIQELAGDLFCRMEDAVDAGQLARLLHIVGQVAACESRHLDAVERHWKAAHEQARGGAAPDELQQIGGAGAEDDFADLVAQVRDTELLFGEGSLLAVFGPLVSFICSSSAAYPDAALQRVAALTLAKLMAVSAPFCEQHLALFLTVLEKSPDPVVRSNCTVAFGDLVQAFGRIVDENISFLFARLDDSDPGVRRNTLLVLTHLTLTGLIKVKGQIGEVARCLLDEDERIVALTRLFFHELASKDPALIYNHIPDILSTLTSSTAAISEDDFQAILRFVMDFVKKERQMEGLLEKLCQRFRLCSTPRQARDLAFCLSLVSYNSERSVRRLVDAFPLFQDKLADLATYRCFADILAKARKTGRAAASPETKQLLEDFEARLLRAAGQAAAEAAEDGEGPAADVFEVRAQARPRKPATRRPARAKFHVPSSDDDDEEEEDEGGEAAGSRPEAMDVESGDEAIPRPKARERIKVARGFGRS